MKKKRKPFTAVLIQGHILTKLRLGLWVTLATSERLVLAGTSRPGWLSYNDGY